MWLPPKARLVAWLPGMVPTPSAAVTPPSNTFTANSAQTANQTTYTFVGTNVGTADATRRIIVSATAFFSGSPQTISSGTIGGTAATVHLNSQNTSGNGGVTGFMSAPLAAGTTATIAVTFSGGVLDCGIGVWALYNAVHTTPDFTASANNSLTSISTTININSNGSLFSSTYAADTAGDASFSYTAGATQRWFATLEAALSYGGASESGLASETGRTITVTNGGTSSEFALAAISWT